MKEISLLVFAVCVVFSCNLANGQMETRPAELFSRDAVLLVETPNGGDLLRHMKAGVHDFFYGKLIDSGSMKLSGESTVECHLLLVPNSGG